MRTVCFNAVVTAPRRNFENRKSAALARMLAPKDPVRQALLREAHEKMQKGEIIDLETEKALKQMLPKVKLKFLEELTLQRRWHDAERAGRLEILDSLKRNFDYVPRGEIAQLFRTATKEEAYIFCEHLLDLLALRNDLRKHIFNLFGTVLENANHEIRNVIREELGQYGLTAYERRLDLIVRSGIYLSITTPALFFSGNYLLQKTDDLKWLGALGILLATAKLGAVGPCIGNLFSRLNNPRLKAWDFSTG